MVIMDPIDILEHRVEFLEGIIETAKLCNWSEEKLRDLHSYLLDEVIRIDNLMFNVYEESQDRDLALAVWDSQMEELRHWLTLYLGIKIKFI